MKCLILHRFVLAASLCLAATAAQADEPAKAEAEKKTQADEVRYHEDLNLLHSRIRLANEINRFSDFDAEVALLYANGLGVDVAVPDAALKAQLNLPDGKGLTVTQVPDDSIGGKAGLKVHDVIVQVNDEAVGEPAALGKLLDAADGKSVKIRLWRAGKQTQLEALPKKPELVRLKLNEIKFTDLDNEVLVSSERYRIGVTLSEADETLRQQLRLASGEGLVVTDVAADSAAAKAGIQMHDVLTMLDGKRLTTVEAINAQIQELRDKSVELRLLRSGKEVTVQIAAIKTHEAAFTDRPTVVWGSRNCRDCHVADAAHQRLAWTFGASRSAWTDGHHHKLFQYEDAVRARIAAAQQPGGTAPPQKQIEALKGQLAEMQKTLADLEQSLQQPAKEEEKK
ncbi:MAG: PDZ domain-containing protein [Planctomycetaceae bacterium]|nr:PDZ domain-containing protein [Planctomycetaceae bacterium]